MVDYTFSYKTAGRHLGSKAWRDPSDLAHIYHIRDRNVLDLVTPEGFEAVKINVVTGAVTVLAFWSAASSYGTLGACFTTPTDIDFVGQLAGPHGGTKVYLIASSGTQTVADSTIVEFNKADFTISKSFDTAVGVAPRTGGTAVFSVNGTYMARAGDSDLNAVPNPDTFTTSYIELYRPSNDAYGYVTLSSLGITEFVGMHYKYSSPICFDNDGFLYFVGQPWAAGVGGRPNRQTAPSTLFKMQIQEAAGVLSLVLVDEYAIDDGFSTWDAGVGVPTSFSETFGYKRMVFDTVEEKIYLFCSWRSGNTQDDDAGWFIEFDVVTETFTRGGAASPITWSAGKDRNAILQPYANNGYSDSPVLVTYLNNSGVATAEFNFFNIEAGTETQELIQANFSFSVDLEQAALFHTSTGDHTIYAENVDFEDLGGFQSYRDGLFIIAVVDTGSGLSGGSGTQLEPLGCIVRAQPYALEVRDLNSVLELGPFRFVEQKESDETSMITTLILGLTEADTGLVSEVDMALISGNVDMETLVDVLGDDIYIDMGEGIGNSDDFTLELLGNDDGSTYPGAPIEFKPEVLTAIEDRGSTKQYSPTGYSFIYHRVRLKATEIDEKFAVKFVDISGQLTGRLL